MEKINKQIIDNGIRYSTDTGKLLAYTEHTENKFEFGPFDKLLFQGIKNRYYLAIQHPEKYKNGDNSVKITPLTKEESKAIYDELAVKEVDFVNAFEEIRKA